MHFSVVPGVGEGLIPSGSQQKDGFLFLPFLSHQHSSQVLRPYLYSPFVFIPRVSLPLAFLECLEEKGLLYLWGYSLSLQGKPSSL